MATLEFAVLYEQSDFFNTQDEASKATNFYPNFELLQRNTYELSEGQLRLTRRDSLIGKRWERQKGIVLEFACWTSLPFSPITARTVLQD
jgi:hypothetical protein